MDSFWKLFLTLLLVATCFCTDVVTYHLHMKDFIRVVQSIEADNPKLQPMQMLKFLRKVAVLETPLIKRHLGQSGVNPVVINSTISDYIAMAISHGVTGQGVEKGVVLTDDGTTVALTPVLLGIEAGLRGHVLGLFPLTLGKTLALSFLRHSHDASVSSTSRLGPDGCWDSVTAPKTFTLSGVPTLATDALVNGGMDGLILGSRVTESPPCKLSTLLKSYYCHLLDTSGTDAGPALISQLRRMNFKKLVSPLTLRRRVRRSVVLYEALHRGTKAACEKEMKVKEFNAMVTKGLEEFVHRYMDCPVIIPRCMWGAEQYRGTPLLLTLPLSFLYIHHTYQPGKPCLTFEQCSKDMRAMQRFHQEDRGWDDIGYSFVAGSDGYLYEGRGWHWQGAHTKGHNSKGYGVSFIGDYTSRLPAQHSQNLVRHQLTKCAVDGGRLVPNYTIHGHRQLVQTTCPGDAFYAEIKRWDHFLEVQP